MDTGTSPGGPLRVWALLGPRTGDNNQVLALAAALGGRVEPIPLRHNLLRLLPNRFSWSGLASLDAASRARLVPPWPDVVITVGRRGVPAARWIRARSGGRTRIVGIGRPRCHPALLDLVVTTPQYGVPPGPEVIEAPVSLSAMGPARLAEAAGLWRERLRSFPEPRLALLLGGNSPPWRLRPEDAEAACRALLARAAARGGSVLAVASRRTPEAVEQRVRAVLAGAEGPAALLTGSGEENPYPGLLALSAEIAVTADSAAMISEAVATGKPVGLVPVRAGGVGAALLRVMRALRRADAGEDGASLPARLAGRAWGALVRRGLAGWPRDLWFFWREIDHHGLAGTVEAPRRGISPDIAGEAAARVRRLLAGAAAGSGRGSAPPSPARRGGCAAP